MHKLAALLFVFLLGIFCSIWQNVQIVKTGKIISVKEKVLDNLKFKNRMLEVKIANLRSLDRIELISKGELGLTKASEYKIIYLKNNLYPNQVANANKIMEKNKSKFNRVIGSFVGTTVEAKTLE